MRGIIADNDLSSFLLLFFACLLLLAHRCLADCAAKDKLHSIEAAEAAVATMPGAEPLLITKWPLGPTKEMVAAAVRHIELCLASVELCRDWVGATRTSSRL